MPTSGPDGQSVPSAIATHDASQSLPLPSFTALAAATGNADPPPPVSYNMSALSTSRPSTSHADADFHAHESDESEDEGGVSLHLQHEPVQSVGLDPVAMAPDMVDFPHATGFSDGPPAPFIPPAAMSILSSVQNAYASFPPHTALDHHVSALEALSMNQESTPPAPMLPPVPDPFPVNGIPDHSATEMHQHFQDYFAHAYEDHLSMQNTTAFMNPHIFYINTFSDNKGPVMGLEEAESDHLSVVTREDLAGEERDYQGIIWSTRMPRNEFRSKRKEMEKSRLAPAMQRHSANLPVIPKSENFFSFRRLDKRHRPWGPHFQLRNMMAVTSRQDIYYAERLQGIYRTDALGSDAQHILDTTKQTIHGNSLMITTMAAMDDVLLAGGFEGEYAVVDLASADGPHTSMNVIRDWAPETKSTITNHVHLFHDRSTYTPQAVLSSNDFSLRVLDCATNTFKYKFSFEAAVNCSATSPDGRLRVVAGDFPETLITNAETGEVLQTLRAHEGDAFACTWADDGIHVASAAQDGTIAVWDARSWQPLALLPSELSIPRVLKFSPIGSGPRVLVSAEADDYVSIINATTFDNKQVFDFFGQTGGIDFTPDGQSLFVANSEYGLGGIIELERAGGWNAARIATGVEDTYREDAQVDWGYDSDLDDHQHVLCGAEERNRRGLDLGSVDV